VKAGKTTWTENWKSIASFLLEGNTEDFSLFLGRFFRFLNFPFVNLELGLSKFIPNEKYFSTKGDKKIISEIQNRSLAHSQLIFNFATTILESIGVDAFLQKTTLFLVEKVKQKYQDSKWMSYDQMILAVRDSIYNNQHLVSILREKYQVCLLDEFKIQI
jgi:ATP-dependent exoDNAse (exonuclease V) beta subunit